MDEYRLTIFTPVYNRAYCIGQCYESLKRQTDHRFQWMIIDDGSTDGLAEIVSGWQNEKPPFKISYYYKENGGMYTAYNMALLHITSEYWMCIDSDDWMPEKAVEKIYQAMDECEHMDVAGIVGLDADPAGNILGGSFPSIIIKRKKISLIDLKTKVKHNGDMKMVYRTRCSDPYTPMLEIPGEKDFNPYYMMLQMDRERPIYPVNEVFCVVNYQNDGMSQNVWKAYRRSPVSFGMLRLEFLRRKNLPMGFRYRQCVHYVSSWLLTLDHSDKRGRLPMPIKEPLMICAWIPGLLLSIIVRIRTLNYKK